MTEDAHQLARFATKGDETAFHELVTRHFDLLDWWAWPKGRSRVSDPNTAVAWTGRNPAATDQGVKLRLFKTAFPNPRPDQEIKSIDYLSGMAGSAPFMIAMTLEK